MKALIQLRQKAATEVGLVCDEDKSESLKQLSFRWFFQPCSALGGNDGSSFHPKIQSFRVFTSVGIFTQMERISNSIVSLNTAVLVLEFREANSPLRGLHVIKLSPGFH